MTPLPSHAGQWVISYASKGSSGAYPITPFGPGTGQITAWPATANSQGAPGINYGVDGFTNGSITATLTWQAAPGQTNTTDPPPPSTQPVHIKEVAVAKVAPGYWHGTGPDQAPAGTASDGLNDAPQVWGRGYISTSTHLLQRDGSSGVIVLDPVSLSAVCPTSSWATGSPDWVGGQVAGVSLTVTVDSNSRGVTISCPAVDVSKYRDPPLTGPIIVNVRKSDGSLRGDTVLYNDIHPDQIASVSQSFSYHANVVGSWSGTYHWFSSLTGYSDAGSFPSVPDFAMPVPYFTGGSPNPTNAGAIDHIFISMYDGANGAEATGNYQMCFHNEWEPTSWPPDSGYPKQVMGPDPEMPSWPVYPWKMVTPLTELVFPFTTLNVSYQEAGIESVDGGLDLGIDPVTLHFGISGNPTDKFTQSEPMTANPPLKPYQETWAVHREVVSRTKGHLDHYQTHGYSGTGIWRHDVMSGIVLSLYQPYPATDTTPSDPPAGWNPPGY